MKRLIRWIARIVLDPSLLYWVQLSTHDGVMVQVNKIGAGPLRLIGTNGWNGLLPEQEPVSDGLLFNMTKEPASAPGLITLVVLSPLPTGLPRRFTLVADFYLPPDIGPWPVGAQWAATLGMRNRYNPGDPAFHLVGATHQFRHPAMALPNRGKLQIALGAGTGATTTTPDVKFFDPSVAYPDARRQFTLEADIDFDQQMVWSRLRTPGNTWPERTSHYDASTFPPEDVFREQRRLVVGRPEITGVGFGQAFAHGAGFATVTATAFRIYSIKRRWLTSLLLGVNRQA